MRAWGWPGPPSRSEGLGGWPGPPNRSEVPSALCLPSCLLAGWSQVHEALQQKRQASGDDDMEMVIPGEGHDEPLLHQVRRLPQALMQRWRCASRAYPHLIGDIWSESTSPIKGLRPGPCVATESGPSSHTLGPPAIRAYRPCKAQLEQHVAKGKGCSTLGRAAEKWPTLPALASPAPRP